MGACLRRSGFAVDRPHVTSRLISLRVRTRAPLRALLEAGVACGDRMGGPPKDASLQTFPGRVVLYVPKQCLLDAKAVGG